jgi:hypothetical protein
MSMPFWIRTPDERSYPARKIYWQFQTYTDKRLVAHQHNSDTVALRIRDNLNPTREISHPRRLVNCNMIRHSHINSPVTVRGNGDLNVDPSATAPQFPVEYHVPQRRHHRQLRPLRLVTRRRSSTVSSRPTPHSLHAWSSPLRSVSSTIAHRRDLRRPASHVAVRRPMARSILRLEETL